ncbi:hypothetical protein [Nibricoccus sp. IMCC34717]|uniref:hypothetical protein n=1 Tax=Nibricoccus sp. IMCC34717 TaxID=3034021 RepID=UPI00384B1568
MNTVVFPMNTTLPTATPRARAYVEAHRRNMTLLAIQLWRSERLRREQQLRTKVVERPPYFQQPQPPTRPPR